MHIFFLHLREIKGKHLPEDQREELKDLFETFFYIFKPVEEATTKIEYYIYKINSHPVPVISSLWSVPPPLMSRTKKELSKKEIDDLQANVIIEACESPYGSPEVLSIQAKWESAPLHLLSKT